MWKQVADQDFNSYEVSETGQIRNKNKKVLKPCLNKQNGYLQVVLHNGKQYRMFYVHRLVAQLYVPNPNGFKEVNHLDENRANNSFKNLEWCTRKYNVNYGRHNARVSIAKRSLDDKTKIRIIARNNNGDIKSFNSLRQACEACGISRSFLSRRLSNKEPLMGYVFYYADKTRKANNFNTRKVETK